MGGAPGQKPATSCLLITRRVSHLQSSRMVELIGRGRGGGREGDGLPRSCTHGARSLASSIRGLAIEMIFFAAGRADKCGAPAIYTAVVWEEHGKSLAPEVFCLTRARPAWAGQGAHAKFVRACSSWKRSPTVA